MTARLPRALVTALTRLGAAIGFLQTYALPFRRNRGPEGRWWVAVRRQVSRALGTVFDERAGPRPITEGEYAGTMPMSLSEVEILLWQRGFVRNPFSRLKTRGGDPEIGSWAYRESPLARRQLHVMLFPGEGGVDVYAHEEPSSVNPVAGSEHFRGETQHVAAGVERVRERLPLEERRGTVDPPTGSWEQGFDGRAGRTE